MVEELLYPISLQGKQVLLSIIHDVTGRKQINDSSNNSHITIPESIYQRDLALEDLHIHQIELSRKVFSTV